MWAASVRLWWWEWSWSFWALLAAYGGGAVRSWAQVAGELVARRVWSRVSRLSIAGGLVVHLRDRYAIG